MKQVRVRAVDFERRADDIRRINTECFAACSADLRPHGWWWVAEHEGECVGFAGLRYADDKTGYLCRAALVPKVRGMKLQRRLIAVRVRKARRLGFDWLVTDTYRNPASANNLIAAGFRPYLPASAWATRSADYWRLKLRDGVRN